MIIPFIAPSIPVLAQSELDVKSKISSQGVLKLQFWLGERSEKELDQESERRLVRESEDRLGVDLELELGKMS